MECRALEIRITEIGPQTGEGPMVVPERVQGVLRQYEDVFDWPEELPSERTSEHHIHIKGGTEPINVRPYRYAFQQKEEMERLVDEMLSSTIIRPSTGPYSSPVLLVKKEMGVGVFAWITKHSIT